MLATRTEITTPAHDYKSNFWVLKFCRFWKILKVRVFANYSKCRILFLFKRSPNWTFFGIFNELFIRFARNVEWDFFCDLQTLWKYYLFERLCATFFRRFECWFEIIGRRLIFGILSVPFCAVRQGTCKSMDQNEWLLSRTLLSSWLALQLFMCTQNYNLEFIIIYCFKSV